MKPPEPSPSTSRIRPSTSKNSATFSLDYYDPTELETEVKILQSDLLALQVTGKELNLDRRPEFGGSKPDLPSSLDLAPDPVLQGDSAHTRHR